jgi:hypothetical protein
LVFGNSFAPVKLIDAAPDLHVNGVFVFQQPAILFFLRFEKAKQRFLCVGGTGRLNLFLDRASKDVSWISMFMGGSNNGSQN